MTGNGKHTKFLWWSLGDGSLLIYVTIYTPIYTRITKIVLCTFVYDVYMCMWIIIYVYISIYIYIYRDMYINLCIDYNFCHDYYFHPIMHTGKIMVMCFSRPQRAAVWTKLRSQVCWDFQEHEDELLLELHSDGTADHVEIFGGWIHVSWWLYAV